MKLFAILGIIATIIMIVIFIGYAVITNQIIKDQERELEDLRKALHRPHREEQHLRGDTIKFGGF